MSVISPSSRSRATTVVLSRSRWTSFWGLSSTSVISLASAALDQYAPPVGLQRQVVEEARSHQHRHVSPPQGHQRAGAVVPRGPEGVGDLRARPKPGPPRFRRRRDGIDGAGGEQDVAARRGGRAELRVGVQTQEVQAPRTPTPALSSRRAVRERGRSSGTRTTPPGRRPRARGRGRPSTASCRSAWTGSVPRPRAAAGGR